MGKMCMTEVLCASEEEIEKEISRVLGHDQVPIVFCLDG